MDCELLPSIAVVPGEQILGLPTTSLVYAASGRPQIQVSRKRLIPETDEFIPGWVEVGKASGPQNFSLGPVAESDRYESVPAYLGSSRINAESTLRATCQGDSWQTASAYWEIRPSMAGIQPQKVVVLDSAQPLLTDRIERILNGLIGVMKLEAHRNYMPVSRIEVSGFVDREEGIEEIVVTQLVKVSPRSALDYWDRLSAIVMVWFSSLPDELANIATERFSIEVRWEHNATII